MNVIFLTLIQQFIRKKSTRQITGKASNFTHFCARSVANTDVLGTKTKTRKFADVKFSTNFHSLHLCVEQAWLSGSLFEGQL
jgi:hypothetical protein